MNQFLDALGPKRPPGLIRAVLNHFIRNLLHVLTRLWSMVDDLINGRVGVFLAEPPSPDVASDR
mgnify:CR=1 FL=1